VSSKVHLRVKGKWTANARSNYPRNSFLYRPVYTLDLTVPPRGSRASDASVLWCHIKNSWIPYNSLQGEPSARSGLNKRKGLRGSRTQQRLEVWGPNSNREPRFPSIISQGLCGIKKLSTHGEGQGEQGGYSKRFRPCSEVSLLERETRKRKRSHG